MTTREFRPAEARALLERWRDDIAALIEAVQARSEGADVPLADLKALEARIAEQLDAFRAAGVQVKGFAPLLLDFPGRLEGRAVLWCWVEGEPGLGWYHDAALGFAGRRPIPPEAG